MRDLNLELNRTITAGNLAGFEKALAGAMLTKSFDIDARVNFFGATLLHAAVLAGRLEMVELLINSGANVNMLDFNKSTALHFAANKHENSCEVTRLLIAKGANPLAQDILETTPLDVACINENEKVMELLKAAEKTATENKYCSTYSQANNKSAPKIISEDVVDEMLGAVNATKEAGMRK